MSLINVTLKITFLSRKKIKNIYDKNKKIYILGSIAYSFTTKIIKNYLVFLIDILL